MIRDRFCWLLGHSVLLDYSQCVQPEPNVFVGAVVRRCRYCAAVLPGDNPEVGDRLIPGTEPPLMTLAERDAYLESEPA